MTAVAARTEAALHVGRRLREVRTQAGLSLHAVEVASDGVWKAVVVGSYERGDRGITLDRFLALAEWYRVPAAALLPSGGHGKAAHAKAEALEEAAAELQRRAAELRGEAS